jgi:MarR family transcriptional regulator for hemolysin
MALKTKAFSIIRLCDTQEPAHWATHPRPTGTGHVAFRAALAADTPEILRGLTCDRRVVKLDYFRSRSMEANSSTLDFVLRDVARLLRKRFEQNARGSGLTRSQWRVLTYLAQNEGINQSGLAELLDMEPITLCRIVDKLQAFGLIERHPHRSDRRVWILHLTPAAQTKLMQVRKLGDMTRSEALGRSFRYRQLAPVGDTTSVEIESHGRMQLVGGRAKASNSWLIQAKSIRNSTAPTWSKAATTVLRTKSIVCPAVRRRPGKLQAQIALPSRN